MRSKVTVGVISIMIAVCSLTIGGCSGNDSESGENITKSNINNIIYDLGGSSTVESSESASENSESSSSGNSAANAPNVPSGEPTIFIGPDEMPIYDTEVTKNTSNDSGFNKKASEIAAEVECLTIFCEGFQYFKEPRGEAYSSFNNPEMFNGAEFKNELPENKNAWKRINVGDEICGLTLKSATSTFNNYNKDNFDKYQTYYTCDVPDFSQFAEFDGSITLTGYLNSSNRNSYEPDGGELRLTPTENKLPIMPASMMYKIEPETYMVAKSYGGGELYTVNEINLIGLDNPSELDLDCIGIGDTAYVRVTISNIKYLVAQTVTADLVDIEVLSDVLAHEDDLI